MSELVAVKRGTPSFFLSYILRRIERNKNFLCAICGPTGSGKSYSALRIAEILDPEFNIDRVCFTNKEFMRLLNSGTLNTGSVILYDEAGTGLSAQEWQTVQNRLMNYVLQTFRHKNYIVLFTSPHLGFLAAPSRKLLHAYMETVGIDTKKSMCKLKPLLIQVNQRSGEAFFKYLRVVIPGRGIAPVKRLSVGLPSKELRIAYEDRKNAFTHELNKSIERDLHNNEDGRSKALTPKQEDVLRLLQERNTVPDIVRALGIDNTVVYQHLDAIKKKGWRIKPVKEGQKVLYYEIHEPY